MTRKLTDVLKKQKTLRNEADKAAAVAVEAIQLAEKLQEAVELIEAELAEADVVFPSDVSHLFDDNTASSLHDVTPPLPKESKTQPEATVTKAVQEKTAKKTRSPKKKKRAAKTKTRSFTAEGKKNVAQGCEDVLNGKRPPLRLALIKIIGTKAMRAAELVEKLTEKRWLPNSSNPRQYVSYVLSNNTPDTFERTSVRGQYRVTASVLDNASVMEPAETKAETKAVDTVEQDAKLREYGIEVSDGASPDVTPNPFNADGPVYGDDIQ